jgi:uncharacterized membrane protein YdjX (TVP38/TMEM64 family)
MAGAGAAAVLMGGITPFFQKVNTVLRETGPAVFFAAMSVLPAVGFPILPFVLTAGLVFGPQLGVWPTIGMSVAAVAFNVMVSYWLGAGVLRGWVLRLSAWLGYSLPAIPDGSGWQVVTLLRLTPGLPFFMQSYFLGVLRAPFIPYIAVSTLIPAGYITATVLGGDALMRGRGKTAMFILASAGFAAALFHLYRRRRASVKVAATAAPQPTEQASVDT